MLQRVAVNRAQDRGPPSGMGCLTEIQQLAETCYASRQINASRTSSGPRLWLVQFRECLMSFADRARVILVDRIRRDDENIGTLLAISSQSFDASRGRTDQRDRIRKFLRDSGRHPIRVAALRGLHNASRRIGKS